MSGDLDAQDVALDATLRSGQAFRWRRLEGWWYGVLGRAVLRVRQDGGRLHYDASGDSLTPARLRHYFALDLNLRGILQSIDVDWQIHQAILRHGGLRVLHQETWEVLASFICASFNNIARIEGMVERLCAAFGDPIALYGVRRFSFPGPDVLARASERQLRGLGLGYRAPYLLATARAVAAGAVPETQLRRVDYETAKRALLTLDGVGDKVADCVALFGCAQYQAFPIDVWIERAMRYYCRHRRMTRGQLHTYARRHFGPYAGYAQQYLYHDLRTRAQELSHGA